MANRRQREARLDKHMERVVRFLRRQAMTGMHNGRDETMPYLFSCRLADQETRTLLIFTRDTGHHSSGFLKNPDYENCWHLSTSPLPPTIIIPGREMAEPDFKIWRRWVHAFFGADDRYVWSESPKSPQGRERQIWHWRLFCDEHWKPILPRGEVYSKELTEIGWRSSSQVWEEDRVLVTSTVDPS